MGPEHSGPAFVPDGPHDDERQARLDDAARPGGSRESGGPSTDKADESPFGPLVAAAGDYAKGKRPPGSWWGYYFRVLTAQGKNAPGGARSYVADGKMVGGFALVAYPVEYGSTGIMTFIVDQNGRVYQKDLGERTDAIAAAMTAYDPDGAWRLVSD